MKSSGYRIYEVIVCKITAGNEELLIRESWIKNLNIQQTVMAQESGRFSITLEISDLPS